VSGLGGTVHLPKEIQEKPRLIATLAGLLVLVAVGLWVWQSASGGQPVPAEASSGKAFFTIDEATCFVGDASQLPPIPRDGKEAVRAYVFTCDGGKSRFIGYLERYPQNVKAMIESARKDSRTASEILGARAHGGLDSEVKRPLQGAWVKRSSPQGQEIIRVSPPEGKGVGVQAVEP
jgi:hypothetical protein